MYRHSATIPLNYFCIIIALICIFLSFCLQELWYIKSFSALKKADHFTAQIIDKSKTSNKKYPYCLLFHYKTESNPLYSYTIKVWSRQASTLDVGQEIVIEKPYIQETKKSLSLYFKKERLLTHVFVDKLNVLAVTENFSSVSSQLFSIRKNIHDGMHANLSNKSKGLLDSLFFGLKNESIDYKPWQFWGISHYLARSGLHVVVLLALLLPFLMLLPINIVARSFISILLLIGYYLISWSSVSFMRAVCMFIIGKMCFLNYYPIKTTHLVLVIALTFLILNPYYIFFADFQLSFGLTFALACFLEYMQKCALKKQISTIAS
jgi:hypothetical protein